MQSMWRTDLTYHRCNPTEKASDRKDTSPINAKDKNGWSHIPLRRLQTDKMYCHPLQSTTRIEYRSHLSFGCTGSFNYVEWSSGSWKRWLWVMEQMWILDLTWNETAADCCCYTSFCPSIWPLQKGNNIHISCVLCKMRWTLGSCWCTSWTPLLQLTACGHASRTDWGKQPRVEICFLSWCVLEIVERRHNCHKENFSLVIKLFFSTSWSLFH